MKLKFQIFGERVSFFVYKFHFLYTSFKLIIPSFMQKIRIAKIEKKLHQFHEEHYEENPGNRSIHEPAPISRTI